MILASAALGLGLLPALETATIVIVAGSGDSKYRRADFDAIQSVTTLRRFESLKDNSLCAKLEEKYYVLVRPTFAPLRRMQFRKHVLQLYREIGFDKPIRFGKLVEGQFAHSLDSSLKTAIPLRFSDSTLVALSPGLTVSLDLPEFPSEISYGGNKPQLSSSLLEALTKSAPSRLSSRQAQTEYLASLIDQPRSIEVNVFPPRQSAVEISSSTDALSKVNEYLSKEESRVDQEFEQALADPNLTRLRSTRLLKSISQAKNDSPDFYELYRGFYEQELQRSLISDTSRFSARFESAKLNSTYGFFVQFWDGKRVTMFAIK